MQYLIEILSNTRPKSTNSSVFSSFVKLELTEDKLLLILRRCSNFLYDRIDTTLREMNDKELLERMGSLHYIDLPKSSRRAILGRYGDVISKLTTETKMKQFTELVLHETPKGS